MSKVLGSDDPKKNLWGKIHEKIANELATLEEGDSCLILIPRGHLKSTLVTQGWGLQQLIKDTTKRILIASGDLDKAKGFADAIRDQIANNPKFIQRFGYLKDDRLWSKDKFNIKGHQAGNKEPSVTTASIGTDMTSQHYDIIILDDLVNRKFTTSPEQRKKASDFYMDCVDLLEPTGLLLIIGTRWHFADLYSSLLEQNKKRKTFKFIVDEPTMYHPKWTRRDFKKMIGDPETTYCFPEKFNAKVVKEEYNKKVSKPNGTYEFSCQQMNFPVSDDNAKFRFEDIKFVKEYPSSCVLYQTIDPAGSDKITSTQDDTAIATTGIDINLDLYCVDVWADKTTSAGLFVAAHNEYCKYPQTRRIGIETNFNNHNALYIKEQYPDMAAKMTPYRASNMATKDSRIMSLQPYVHNGKLYIVEHDDGIEYTIGDRIVKLHEGQYKLLMQMIDYGNTEHDDAVDAVAASLEFMRKPKNIRPQSTETWIPRSRKTGY